MQNSATLSFTLHLASSRNLSSWVRTTRHLNRRFPPKTNTHTTIKSVLGGQRKTLFSLLLFIIFLSLLYHFDSLYNFYNKPSPFYFQFMIIPKRAIFSFVQQWVIKSCDLHIDPFHLFNDQSTKEGVLSWLKSLYCPLDYVTKV